MVHVTVDGRRESRQGIRVHRSLSLNAAVHNGLPLTTPARTLRDLRTVLTSHELDRAEEQAYILGLVIPDGATATPSSRAPRASGGYARSARRRSCRRRR